MSKKQEERVYDEVTEEEINLAADTLVGNIRDFLLDRVKHARKPWDKMSEEEQAGEIACATGAAETLVRKAVRIIAQAGRKTITGNLEQVTVKDGIKAVVTVSKHDECRHELVDSCGSSVLIVVADTEEFDAHRDPVGPDPDQQEIDVDVPERADIYG